MSLETSPELGFLELEIHSEWYYQLLASMIGFKIYKEDIETQENLNIRINIRLTQTVLEGDEVIVTANSPETIEENINRMVENINSRLRNRQKPGSN